MKVFGDPVSGNCYKIQLTAALLNIEYQWVNVDILKKQTQTNEFLLKNPNGKIPIVELDDGKILCESNAIINYLATGTELLPQDKYENAQVLQWQFFEQYSHEPFIAVARFINKYLGLPAERKQEYKNKQEGGHKALSIMESTLSKQDFLVGNTMTVADVSLYAYTHVAHEGGFDLSQYPAIQNWLQTIENLKSYIPMGKPKSN